VNTVVCAGHIILQRYRKLRLAWSMVRMWETKNPSRMFVKQPLAATLIKKLPGPL
jgi:hypothetical protein